MTKYTYFISKSGIRSEIQFSAEQSIETTFASLASDELLLRKNKQGIVTVFDPIRGRDNEVISRSWSSLDILD